MLRLLKGDSVHLLLGPYSSHLTMAAAEIVEGHEKILWNYGGTSDEIFSRGWRYILGISSPASDYFRGFPRWLTKEDPELRRIYVFQSGKGTFGRQVSRGGIESVRDTGHSVQSVPIDAPVVNSDAVRAMLHEATPEAIVLASSSEDELAIMRSRSRWPTTVRAVAAVSAGTASFGSELGQISNGVIGPSEWEPDMNFPSIVGPSSDAFVRALQKEFGTAPNYVAAGAFAAGLILSECIRKAVSLDNSKLRDVASHLDINTFYGRFRIDSQTGKQVGHRNLLVQWKNSAKILLPTLVGV